MLMNDFERGIQRLIGNFGEKNISAGLIRELEHRFFSLDSSVWDKMITLVLDRCRYAPKMVNFREVAESLRNDIKSKNTNERFCGKCLLGFEEKYALVRGIPHEVLVPCHCHPAPPPYNNPMPVKKEWITKEEHDFLKQKIRYDNGHEAHEERKAIQSIAKEEETQATKPPDQW
tara:strand:+ start:841 stop:1362 length:522 start_codon:yes stop_codon:yes gene_type:complete